jgi:glutamyl-tRNA synthetase
MAKLDSLNAHYIREATDERLAVFVAERLASTLDRPLNDVERKRLVLAMPALKPRAKTMVELAAKALFYVSPRPIRPDDKAAKLLTDDSRRLLSDLGGRLAQTEWRPSLLEEAVRRFAEEREVALGAVAQPVRAALTGSTASPGLFEVMEVLGREESLGRLSDAAEAASQTA